MVNDPILLRRILEALLLDDLKQKQQLNLKELLEEMGYPTDIEYDVEERIENYEITPRQLCIWLVQKKLKSSNLLLFVHFNFKNLYIQYLLFIGPKWS